MTTATPTVENFTSASIESSKSSDINYDKKHSINTQESSIKNDNIRDISKIDLSKCTLDMFNEVTDTPVSGDIVKGKSKKSDQCIYVYQSLGTASNIYASHVDFKNKINKYGSPARGSKHVVKLVPKGDAKLPLLSQEKISYEDSIKPTNIIDNVSHFDYDSDDYEKNECTTNNITNITSKNTIWSADQINEGSNNTIKCTPATHNYKHIIIKNTVLLYCTKCGDLIMHTI